MCVEKQKSPYIIAHTHHTYYVFDAPFFIAYASLAVRMLTVSYHARKPKDTREYLP